MKKGGRQPPLRTDSRKRDQLSCVTPAALMTGVQRRSRSSPASPSACRPRRSLPGMSLPRSSRRLRVASSSSALSSARRQLVERSAFGVPLGANSAFQAEAWNSGRPASLVVGTSGSAGLRSGGADRIGLDGAALDLRHGIDDLVAHVIDLAADQRVHRRAGALVTGSRSASRRGCELSSRQVVNDTEPTPACAMFSLSAFAFT